MTTLVNINVLNSHNVPEILIGSYSFVITFYSPQEGQAETERRLLADQERERRHMMKLLDNNDTEDDTVSSMEYDHDNTQQPGVNIIRT